MLFALDILYALANWFIMFFCTAFATTFYEIRWSYFLFRSNTLCIDYNAEFLCSKFNLTEYMPRCELWNYETKFALKLHY